MKRVKDKIDRNVKLQIRFNILNDSSGTVKTLKDSVKCMI